MASAMTPPSYFAQAIRGFIESLKENEDPRSPFYHQVLQQAATLLQSNECHKQSVLSAGHLQNYIESLDAEQMKRGKTRWIGRKLQPLVSGLTQFTGAFDVMIQAGPAPAMLVYGSAKLVIQLAYGFAECFDSVVDALRELGVMLECYHIFSKTYEHDNSICGVLVECYKNILDFWRKAAKLFTRNGVKTFLRGVMKPFDSEWKTLKSRLESDTRKVSIFAQAIEGSAAKRREAESKKREQQADELMHQKMRAAMLAWLSGPDEVAQIDVRLDLEPLQRARHGDTGEWIFNDPAYQEWLNSCENKNLWLHANPGTGKSVLCSNIVQRLQENKKKVVYFFCSFQEPLKRRITSALKSIAIQLFCLQDEIPSVVERIFQEELRYGRGKLQNSTLIVVVVRELLKRIDRVHVVLDGLDECEDRELVLAMLSECFSLSSLGIVKWLWSSRNEPTFHYLAESFTSQIIEVQKSKVEDDIRLFIEESPDLAGHSAKSIDEWVEASDGNFLWLTLMLRTLTGCDLTCPAEVEEELGKFPLGLTKCYERVLQQLLKRPKKHQELARKLFLIVAYAEQPLALSEVLDALSVGEDESGRSSARKPYESLVKQLCCPLILLDSNKSSGGQELYLRYFHKSTRDFFLQDPANLEIKGGSEVFFSAAGQSHLELAKICLSYLQDKQYQTPQDVRPESANFGEEHCFMRYAALFWHRHVTYAGPSEHLLSLVSKFLRSTNFWSCIRVQTSTAPYLFARLLGETNIFFPITDFKQVHHLEDGYFVSPLPDWLDQTEAGSILLESYLSLIMEWNPVLLQQPQFTLQCHPAVLGKQNIFSYEVLEHKNCLMSMDLCTAAPSTERTGSRLPCIVGCQPTKSGIRVFTIEDAVDESGYALIQWHRSFGQHGLNPSTPFKQKRVWQVKSPYRIRLLQLKSGAEAHEAALWSLDTKTLRLTVSSENRDSSFSPPPEIMNTWSCLRQSILSDNRNLRKFDMRDYSSGHHTVLTCTWQLGTARSGSETTDKDDTSDSDSDFDSDSDVTDSDVTSDGEENTSSIFTSKSSALRKREKPTFRALAIVIDGSQDPHWLSWESEGEMPMNFRLAVSDSFLIWPLGNSARLVHTATGKSEDLPLPGLPLPAEDVLICRDFDMPLGDRLVHCLTITRKDDAESSKSTYNISLQIFDLVEALNGCHELVLKVKVPDIAYTVVTTDAQPTILRLWTRKWVYIAINVPSSVCNLKVLRIPLASPSTAQTHHQPIFVPASFPKRSPKLEIVHTASDEYITCVLESPTDRQKLSDILDIASESDASELARPESGSEALKNSTSTSSPPLTSTTLPPLLLSHAISSLGGWQDWEPDVDGKEPGLDNPIDEMTAYLKGGYAAADQRFTVPIRSGLNWRKSVFVSCW